MVGFMKSALNLFGLNKKEGEAGQSLEKIDLDSFLAALPGLMQFDVTIKKIPSDNGGHHYEVEGPEMDSFLGTSTEMLDALAHLSMRILRKNEGVANAPTGEGNEQFRVTFDAQGFRDRKAEELKALAASQRQKVIDSGGKPAYIRALSPSERKIIHTHLADLGEVTSESIGRGTFKRIRVKLKDDSPFKKEFVPTEGGSEDAQPAEGAEASADGNRMGQPRGPRGAGRRGPGGRGGGFGRGGGRGGRRGPSRGGRPGYGPDSQQGSGFDQDNVGNRDVGVDSQDAGAEVDDNIGNRLRPGESSPYGFGSGQSGNY